MIPGHNMFKKANNAKGIAIKMVKKQRKEKAKKQKFSFDFQFISFGFQESLPKTPTCDCCIITIKQKVEYNSRRTACQAILTLTKLGFD